MRNCFKKLFQWASVRSNTRAMFISMISICSDAADTADIVVKHTTAKIYMSLNFLSHVNSSYEKNVVSCKLTL